MTTPYDDILHLPHPVSDRHPRMSLQDRAAQFSPFAALTGYDAVISETARLTGQQIELGPDARQELNDGLNRLQTLMGSSPLAAVTHFVRDERKDGGSYLLSEGRVQKIDTARQWLLLDGGQQIFFADILSLQILEPSGIDFP